MSAQSALMAQSSSPWRALGGSRSKVRGGATAAAGVPLLCRQRRRPAVASVAAARLTPPPPPSRLLLRSPSSLRHRLAATPPANNSQAAADQFFSVGDREAAQTFAQLLAQAGGQGGLALRPSGDGGGRGLFAEQAATPGDVLLRVPLSACLSIAYSQSGDGRVTIPDIPGGPDNEQAKWPRLASGVRRAAAAAEAAREEAALAEADDEDDGGRPASTSSGAADEADALTWDVILALGVMDALAGDGGRWWARYTAALFPAPETVPLPMCWSPQLLESLRHSSVAEAARAQQLRLRMLYAPFCATPAAEGAPNGGAPSYMQWSFACVRSRVCRLTERPRSDGGSGGNGGNGNSSSAATFALVPFLDCANHSDRPNAAYRLVEENEDDQEEEEARRNNIGNGSKGGATEKNAPSSSSFVELVALSDVRPGDEVCISYTGPPPASATNRMLMAQYGFVPEGGNPRDRYEELAFGAFSLRDPKNKGAAERAAGAGGGAGGEGVGGTVATTAASGFRLRAVQGAVGDGFFLSALKGEDPYAFAALKSLPLARDERDGALGASEAGLPLRPEFSGSGGNGDDAPCPPDASERALAERLLVTLRSGPMDELKGGCTTVREALEQDEALLLRIAAAAGGGGAGAPSLSRDEADPRFAAAVRYRIERARLMLAVERVLLALAGSW